MLEEKILELAKVDIREAMKKEFETNEKVIEEYKGLNRYSKRDNKEKALRAIVRNDSIKGFLSLDSKDQQPKKLKVNYSSSHMSSFNQFVNQVRSGSYADSVRRIAIEVFYHDYTKAGHNYSKERYFLDEQIPEHSKIKSFTVTIFSIIENVVHFIFRNFGWVVIFSFIGLMVYPYFLDESDEKPSNALYSSNTFHDGGVLGGNSSKKFVSDKSQVLDQSGQTRFGNGGVSGFDSASSGSDTSSISQVTVETIVDTETEVINDEVICEVTKCITLGSLEAEVIEVMGVQKKERKSSIGDTIWWHYGDDELSFVQFDSENKVAGWKNVNNILKVSLGFKDDSAEPFKVGSSKETVVKAMGTPDEVNNETYWRYGSSEVFFYKDVVSSYVDNDGNLNAVE